jgi:5-methylcytosine-specific restriction endonuclease McrA
LPRLPKARSLYTKTEKDASWGGDTSFYRKQPWRKMRAYILSLNPLCVHCTDKGDVTPADVVDHIKPIKKGGAKLDESNLQGLCHKCHNRKTYYENHPNAKIQE